MLHRFCSLRPKPFAALQLQMARDMNAEKIKTLETGESFDDARGLEKKMRKRLWRRNRERERENKGVVEVFVIVRSNE